MALLVLISSVPSARRHAEHVLLRLTHASLASLDSSWALNASHNAPLATLLTVKDVLGAIQDVRSALRLRPLDACNAKAH